MSFSNLTIQSMLRKAALFSLAFLVSFAGFSQKKAKPGKQQREYVAIRVYHAADAAQIETTSQYLQSQFLPALDKSGFKRYGAFTAIDNDTAKDKRLYVLIPFSSLSQLDAMTAVEDKVMLDSTTSPAYTRAAYNGAPFTRFETIVLREFEGMPQVKASGVQGNMADRVYELRSYESATEALHRNKVKMFNSGEVDLFQRLGFNAVFYGQVISGSRMPNLMYMTTFENRASRDEHWKAFGADPEWKKMSSDPYYKNNVSRNETTFLRPLAYSKL